MSIVDLHGHPYPSPNNPGIYYDDLYERIAELEFALEDQGWIRLGEETNFQLSRDSLNAAIARSRAYYLTNPLVRRAANLSRFYVFGQGINVQAAHPDVDEVVQRFWHDPKNAAELTTLQELGGKDTQLMTDGNLFIVLFTNSITGRVRVRSVKVDEIKQIICDPEDERTPWYYKREWTERRFNMASGQFSDHQMTAYYPDWKYEPSARERPVSIAGKPVMWNSPIYHIAVGRMPWMTFGLPEFYPVLDWARAYRKSVEDDATRSEALSTFVWKATVKGGAQKVAATRRKLASNASPTSGTVETNPRPTVGATAVTTPGSDLDPYDVSRSILNPDHNRALRQFAVTALDLPETFFGDADVGNHATAQTLDRPTELKYSERQQLWNMILTRILEYVIRADVLAPRGMLIGREVVDPFSPDVTEIELAIDPETGLPIPTRVDIDFPKIVERDIGALVGAIIKFATLDGKSLAGTVDMGNLRRMLLSALKEDDLDDVLAQIDEIIPAEDHDAGPQERQLAQEIRSLREAFN